MELCLAFSVFLFTTQIEVLGRIFFQRSAVSFFLGLRTLEGNYSNICTVHLHCLYNGPTNAQLIKNLLYCSILHYSYMFRRYCVIFRELVVSTCLLTYLLTYSTVQSPS